jgi:NAD(P)-dependent dehydrogenase (short-subunit alcohol dehydrogenase family)
MPTTLDTPAPTATLPLAGRTALVTGASRGIGAAIARRLAREGAHVIVHYGASADAAATVVAGIRDAGGSASLVQADFAQEDAAERLVAGLDAPRIDILVNNAGIAPFATSADTDAATFDRIIAVNVRSLFLVTRALLPRITDGGSIVNLSTRVTKVAFAGIPVYAASKGFVDVLTLQLAAELAPRRITVNAVAPGAIDTEMSAWMHQPGGAEAVASIQALPGFAQPERIASVVSFLVGPDGAWTTGHVLDASGGTKL